MVKRANIPLVAIISGAAFALPALTLGPLVVSLTQGVIPTVGILGNFGAHFDPVYVANWTPVSLVQNVSLTQALVAYGVFALGAASIYFSITMGLGIGRLVSRKP